MLQTIDNARLKPGLRGRTRRAPKVCAAPGCPTITTTGSYCTTHQGERDRERGTTSERGYGAHHQATRKALLPAAIGKPCPLCNEPMLATQQLDLDHTIPLAHDKTSRGDRIVHANCNRAAGARL